MCVASAQEGEGGGKGTDASRLKIQPNSKLALEKNYLYLPVNLAALRLPFLAEIARKLKK
jgi:hypothetical protein